MFPVIQGVSPSLPFCGKCVGRSARDEPGATVRVQEKGLRVGPNVGALMGDEHGHIAEDPHAPIRAVLAKHLPLSVEEKLLEREIVDVAGRPFAQRGERRGLPPGEVFRPGRPVGRAVARSQGGEETVVVEPDLLTISKLPERSPDIL
jgi:hypothetical protein